VVGPSAVDCCFFSVAFALYSRRGETIGAQAVVRTHGVRSWGRAWMGRDGGVPPRSNANPISAAPGRAFHSVQLDLFRIALSLSSHHLLFLLI